MQKFWNYKKNEHNKKIEKVLPHQKHQKPLQHLFLSIFTYSRRCHVYFLGRHCLSLKEIYHHFGTSKISLLLFFYFQVSCVVSCWWSLIKFNALLWCLNRIFYSNSNYILFSYSQCENDMIFIIYSRCDLAIPIKPNNGD